MPCSSWMMVTLCVSSGFVPGAGIGITVSAFEWDEFIGIVVDHGYSLQIHLVAVYDRQTRRCVWEWRGTGMKAVGKWSVFDLGIARVKGLADLIEQSFGLRLKFLEAVFAFLPKSDMIIKNFRFYTKK